MLNNALMSTLLARRQMKITAIDVKMKICAKLSFHAIMCAPGVWLHQIPLNLVCITHNLCILFFFVFSCFFGVCGRV